LKGQRLACTRRSRFESRTGAVVDPVVTAVDPENGRGTEVRKWTVAMGGVLLVTTLITAFGSPTLAGATTLLNESFQNSTTTASVSLPPSINGSPNVACITAGTSLSQTPIPGCGLTTPDPSGSGALRLTSATGGVVGGVFSNLSLPASSGLDDTFTLYQYDTTTSPAADGIGFVINAENPASPAPPVTIGRSGGSLGYSASYPGTPGTNGLADGYLGVGFDTYGNFSATGYEGTGCTNPSWLAAQPNQVVVRGPGNAEVGYCALQGSQNVYGGSQVIGSAGSSRAAAAVPVEVVLNTTASSYDMAGAGYTSIAVPAGDYGVAWTPIGGSAKDFVGALPSTNNGGIPANLYPSSWINPSTGIPYQLGLGGGGSTGLDTNIHEVTAATSATIQSVPVLTAAITDEQSHYFTQSGTATFNMTAGVSSSGASESQPVTMTTTLPRGITPESATGTGWTCATVGQVVTCTYPGSPTISAGTHLPEVSLPASVGAGVSGAVSATVTASSNDADPAQATDAGTAGPASALTPTNVVGNSTPTALGSTVTFTATVAGSGATPTGSVVWSVGGTAGATSCSDGSSTTLVSGTATCTIVASDPGTLIVSDAYGGDANYLPVTSSPDTVTVASGPSPPTTTTTTPVPVPPPAPNARRGYWDVGADGGVFAFGQDPFLGSLPGLGISVSNIVGVTGTPDGNGYWLVGSDGGVFAFGNAHFYGSLPSQGVHAVDITGIVGTPDGHGYWMVGSDGGVFAFGDATFFGSLPGRSVVLQDIVGIAPSAGGAGYWLVGSNGGVTGFGNATAYGSEASDHLEAPIVGISATSDGNGYWLVGSDGGVFAFGDAPFEGSLGAQGAVQPVVGIAPTQGGHGYWLSESNASTIAFGDAPLEAPLSGTTLYAPITGVGD